MKQIGEKLADEIFERVISHSESPPHHSIADGIVRGWLPSSSDEARAEVSGDFRHIDHCPARILVRDECLLHRMQQTRLKRGFRHPVITRVEVEGDIETQRYRVVRRRRTFRRREAGGETLSALSPFGRPVNQLSEAGAECRTEQRYRLNQAHGSPLELLLWC